MKSTIGLMAMALTCVSGAAWASIPDDANALRDFESRESHRAAFTPETAVKFARNDHVFVTSALAVDFTYRKATVTLPLYRGVSPAGDAVYYIITDASDFDFARQLGLNFAPKLRNAASSMGAQMVTLEDGLMHFKGNVDFSLKHAVTPGSPAPFPPKVARFGAIGDDEWSSVGVLPSGVVVNVQMVHNGTGNHNRVKALDLDNRTVTLSLLDGVQGGKQYYYHLVTDVSAELPSVLENGTFTPRLANVAAYGKSEPSDNSALLGFSPVVNGLTDTSTHEDQGFAASLANGGIDPINVFPLPPTNEDSSENNNYSPLWDAHVSMWTEKALQSGQVHRIHSMDEQKKLIAEGLLTSAAINPPGPGNAFVGGLRPTRAIINCPVIAQPDLPAR